MTNSGGWPFSILDDKYLTENVEDYAVSVGEQFILPNRPHGAIPLLIRFGYKCIQFLKIVIMYMIG